MGIGTAGKSAISEHAHGVSLSGVPSLLQISVSVPALVFPLFSVVRGEWGPLKSSRANPARFASLLCLSPSSSLPRSRAL